MKSSVKFALSLAALAGMTMPAMAHSILIGGAPSVSNVGPNDNKYTYSPFVTSSSSVQSGTANSDGHTTYQTGQADFFILVDFNGYIGGTAFAPSGWSATAANTYGTPIGGNFYTVPTGTTSSNAQTFFDDPSIPDLLFTYIRGSEIDGQASLGAFGGESTFAQFTFNALLEAQDHSGSGNASTIGNADLYLAPGPNVGSNPTPLPAAAWGGMGMMGLLGGMKLLRRRR